MDSGAIQIYFSPDAPVANFEPSAPPVHVGNNTVSVQQSRGTAELDLPRLPTDIPKSRQFVPSFAHTLVGIEILCDTDFNVTLDKDSVTISDPAGRPIITGWNEPEGARLWRINLVHNKYPDPPIVPG